MHNRWLIIHLSIFVGLGAILWAEFHTDWGSGHKGNGPISTPSDEPPPMPTGTFSLPPIDEYSEFIERPLFTASRRPRAETADAAPDTRETGPAPASAPARKRGFKLSAVIIAGQERAALLEHPDTRKPTRVHLGETIAGWSLTQVEPDAVVLENGGQSTQITLREFPTPPPPRPARAKPRQPRTQARPSSSETEDANGRPRRQTRPARQARLPERR